MKNIFLKSLFAIFFCFNSAIVSSQENDFKVIKNRIYQVLISNDSNLSFPYTFTTDEELEKTLNEFDEKSGLLLSMRTFHVKISITEFIPVT